MDKNSKKPRETEKERLMREVLGKKRDFSFDASKISIIDDKAAPAQMPAAPVPAAPSPAAPAPSSAAPSPAAQISAAAVPSPAPAPAPAAAEAARSLQDVILENSKTLDEIAASLSPGSEIDIESLKAEIEADFGVSPDTQVFSEKLKSLEAAAKAPAAAKIPVVAAKNDAAESKDLFADIEIAEVREKLKTAAKMIADDVYGQDAAISQMMGAFLRPYIAENKKGGIRSVLYIEGPNGSGRRHLLDTAADVLSEIGLISNNEIDMLEMTSYQSQSTFVQDFFMAAKSENPFILIGNYEMAHPSVSRSISEIITTGALNLEDRYAYKNGVLQKSSQSLQKDLTTSIDAGGKMIVFISSNPAKNLMNVYGKKCADMVKDIAVTNVLRGENLEKVFDNIAARTMVRSASGSMMPIQFTDAAKFEILRYFDPEDGVHPMIDVLQMIQYEIIGILTKKIMKNVNVDYSEGFLLKSRKGSGTKLSVEGVGDQLAIEVQQELEKIVGLTDVKNYLISLEDLIQANQKRRKKGLKASPITKHMIFTGNPGTGKTTIARLVSRLLKSMGALAQGHLVEVTRADLVGQYVGHTAPLTMNVIKSALGGVLFIDEAYSLYRGKDDSFGLEAIDMLVKGMEDNRENLVVILAGYDKEMEYFLQSNSGLKSRFPRTIEFSDYTADELVQISHAVAASKEYKIDDEANPALKEYFEKVQNIQGEIPSNGRTARNLVESAIIIQSGRILKDGSDISKITATDIKAAIEGA